LRNYRGFLASLSLRRKGKRERMEEDGEDEHSTHCFLGNGKEYFVGIRSATLLVPN